MKHLYKFSLLLLALLLPATALAHDFEVDGIYYNINGTEATVTYRGSDYYQYSNWYTGYVTIPATVTYGGTTYSVTSIGNFAFWKCSRLTRVTIPNSVTSIGSEAFYYCSGLTSVSIGNSVTSIGESAFDSCSGLTSIVIPNSVTSIAQWAFYGCSGLTSITVAGNNPKYDSRNNCNAIIETASHTLIFGCKYSVIPYSVTAIGDYAFSNCSSLTSFTIPNSVTTIGVAAFGGCSGLTSIDIPNSVISIGNGAFSNTAWFNNQPNGLVYAGLVAYKYKGTMPNGTSITIRVGTLGIAGEAFSGCSGLTSITIPNSVTNIGLRAFYNCSGLTSIIIPNSVTSIDKSAFYVCTGLTSITIPNSVTSIGDYAFSSCSGLTSITVAGNNPKYDSRGYCNAIIETASNKLIAGCKNTVIPNSVTSIGYAAFYGCSGLTSIDIPNSVTSIGYAAFYDCNRLTSVTIGNSVTSIGDGAFYDCSLIEIYSLAFTPPIIDSYTFSDYNVAILYVPKEAMNAYKEADYWKNFINIVGIEYVPPVSTFVVDGIYYRVTDVDEVSAIANEEVEAFYTGDVIIPASVTFEEDTFTVTGIESNAFDGCFELTSVVIPNSVETIGEQAFQGCTGLTSVTIGSGVTAIGAKAFNYCNALETVKCLGTVPPVMASTDCFSAAAYNRATLLVPRYSEAIYAAANYWYKFAHIDGWGSAGRGDIDGDGEVSIRDVTTLIDAILTGEHEGIYVESADVNSNGRLDIGDVTTIIDMLLNDIE